MFLFSDNLLEYCMKLKKKKLKILLAYQLAGVLKSDIFLRSSKQSRCGNANLACLRKYGNRSSTCPAPVKKEQIFLNDER